MITRNDAGKIAHVAAVVRPDRKDRKGYKVWLKYTTALCTLCMLENREVMGGVFLGIANGEVEKDDPLRIVLEQGKES